VGTQQSPGLEVNANDVVAFFVEIGALALLASAGAGVDGPMALRVALAIALPVVAAVLWGLFAAPRARIRSVPLQLATKVLVLGAGVVAGHLVLPGALAVTFMVVVLVNTVLMYVGPFARPRVS